MYRVTEGHAANKGKLITVLAVDVE